MEDGALLLLIRYYYVDILATSNIIKYVIYIKGRFKMTY